MYADAPQEFIYAGNAKYRPANYGGGYSGRDVTLRTGLVRSLNVVTVDVAMRAGLTRVATLAERLGLPCVIGRAVGRDQRFLKLALGGPKRGVAARCGDPQAVHPGAGPGRD